MKKMFIVNFNDVSPRLLREAPLRSARNLMTDEMKLRKRDTMTYAGFRAAGLLRDTE